MVQEFFKLKGKQLKKNLNQNHQKQKLNGKKFLLELHEEFINEIKNNEKI